MNRSDFPMLKKKLIYFDSAATAQKPQCVIDAISDCYENHYATVNRAIYSIAVDASERYHQARKTVQQFINARHAEEIIFTRGTTESLNFLAQMLCKTGDKVLLTAMEHHANLIPWQMAGANITIAPINEKGELLLEEIHPHTKIVSICHVSNVLGTENPIKKIVQMAKKVGAIVIVDGAQSAPHQQIDVQDLGCDFFVFSGHKLYGPTGIGVLFGREELLEKLPPPQGGGDMVETCSYNHATYQKAPLKFEAGTPLIAEAAGLKAAIDYLANFDIEKICAYEKSLLEYATDRLQKIPGLHILGTAAKKGAILSFAVDGVHALDIGTLLDLKGIAVRTGTLCAQPLLAHFGVTSVTRASFSFTNTTEEIDTFVSALEQAVNQLKN